MWAVLPLEFEPVDLVLSKPGALPTTETNDLRVLSVLLALFILRNRGNVPPLDCSMTGEGCAVLVDMDGVDAPEEVEDDVASLALAVVRSADWCGRMSST